MDSAIGDLGGLSAAGIFALLLVREFLNFSARREDAASIPEDTCPEAQERLGNVETSLEKLASSTGALAKVVGKTDSNGMPLIYRDGALARAVDQLGRNVEKLTDKVDRLQ